MDELAPRRDRDQLDLASIVLADARERRTRPAAMRLGSYLEDRGTGSTSGYDARSVLVLAIVVAALAMVVGWTATSVRSDPTPTGTVTGSLPKATAGAVGSGATSTRDGDGTGTTIGATAGAGSVDATPLVMPGPNLVLGRITMARSSNGSPVLRVAVANAGNAAITAAAGAELLMLVDGDVVGTSALGAIAADGGRAIVDVPLTSCFGGPHAVTAVVDTSAVVREVDERDNASSRSLQIVC